MLIRECFQMFCLATADYRRERLLSILGLAAVLAPLLVLYGVKFGVVTTMVSRMRSDPLTLELSPVSSGHFTQDFFTSLRQEPGVAASGAPGLLLQIVGGVAQSREELLTAALEGQILVPDGVDGGNGILPLPQSPGDDLAHGAAQAAVDVRQLRLPGKQLLLTLPELPGPALLILIKAGHGPAENFTVIGHRVPLLYHFIYFPMRESFLSGFWSGGAADFLASPCWTSSGVCRPLSCQRFRIPLQ